MEVVVLRPEGYTLPPAIMDKARAAVPGASTAAPVTPAEPAMTTTAEPRPIIELDNGWYDVEVLAGALVRDGLYEPAFEFVLKKRWSRGEAAGVDTGYAFGLRGYFD